MDALAREPEVLSQPRLVARCESAAIEQVPDDGTQLRYSLAIPLRHYLRLQERHVSADTKKGGSVPRTPFASGALVLASRTAPDCVFIRPSQRAANQPPWLSRSCYVTAYLMDYMARCIVATGILHPASSLALVHSSDEQLWRMGHARRVAGVRLSRGIGQRTSAPPRRQSQHPALCKRRRHDGAVGRALRRPLADAGRSVGHRVFEHHRGERPAMGQFERRVAIRHRRPCVRSARHGSRSRASTTDWCWNE